MTQKGTKVVGHNEITLVAKAKIICATKDYMPVKVKQLTKVSDVERLWKSTSNIFINLKLLKPLNEAIKPMQVYVPLVYPHQISTLLITHNNYG